MLLFSDSNTWLDVVKQGGPIGALLGVFLYGGFREKPWWVFGWYHRDTIAERDERYHELAERHERLRDEKNAWRDSALAAGNVSLYLSEEKRKRD